MAMTIKQIVEALPYYFQIGLTPFIWGKSGIGKSQCINQFAGAHGLRFLDIRLGQLEVGDLLGLPTITQTEKGPVTEYAMPKWFQMAMEGNCIICWDEINRAKRDVLQAVFQIVYDKKMHLLELPKTTYQVCISNPNIDGFHVTDVDDEAFVLRFGHITCVPNVQEWLEYARENKFHPSMVEMVSTDPNSFGEHEFKLPITIKTAGRDKEFVSRLAYLTEKPTEFHGKKVPTLRSELFEEMIQGIMGEVAALIYLNSCKKIERPIEAEQVLSHYKKVQPKVKKQIEDFINKKDLLHSTLTSLVDLVKTKKPLELGDTQLNNVLAFIADIPAELAVTACKTLGELQSVGPSWARLWSERPEIAKRLHRAVNQPTA